MSSIDNCRNWVNRSPIEHGSSTRTKSFKGLFKCFCDNSVRGLVPLLEFNHGELLEQLSTRWLQYDSKARIQLESKESMRVRGLSSPDRADAVIGAAVTSMPWYGGGITAADLAWISFGRPVCGAVLFESEPVSFE